METSDAVFLSLGGKFRLYFLFCWGEEEGKGVKWPRCLGREAREPLRPGPRRGVWGGFVHRLHRTWPAPPRPCGRTGRGAGCCPCWPGGSTQVQRAAFASVLFSGPLNEFKNLGHFSG